MAAQRTAAGAGPGAGAQGFLDGAISVEKELTQLGRLGYTRKVPDPREIYESRLTKHRAEAENLRARERNLSIARVIFFAIAVIIAIVAYAISASRAHLASPRFVMPTTL